MCLLVIIYESGHSVVVTSSEHTGWGVLFGDYKLSVVSQYLALEISQQLELFRKMEAQLPSIYA